MKKNALLQKRDMSKEYFFKSLEILLTSNNCIIEYLLKVMYQKFFTINIEDWNIGK